MPLDEREMRILYCLTRWPSARSKDISSMLGLRFSSFSSIKRKLVEEGYIRPFRVLNPLAMGFDIRYVEYGMLKPDVEENRLWDDLKRAVQENSSIYVMESDGTSYFFHLLCPDHARMGNILLTCGPRDRNIEAGAAHGQGQFYDEVGTNRLLNLFDFSGIMKYQFGTEVTTSRRALFPDDRPHFPHVDPIGLSPSLRRAIPFLVRQPLLSDSEIGYRLGCSRQKIGQSRLQLERKGVLISCNSVDTTTLGMAVRGHFTVEFDREADPGRIREYEKMLMGALKPVFWFSSNVRSTFLFDLLDLADYKGFVDRLYGLMEDPPVRHIVGTPIAKVSTMDICLHHDEDGCKTVGDIVSDGKTPQSIKGNR